jgi:uncharacterized protein with PIN domain
LRPFFEAAERHEFQLVTSVVTLIEVLILPLRTGRRDLAREYRDILVRSASLKAIPVTLEISEEAALAFAHFSRVSWNQTRCLWCSNGIRAKLDPTSKSTA